MPTTIAPAIQVPRRLFRRGAAAGAVMRASGRLRRSACASWRGAGLGYKARRASRNPEAMARAVATEKLDARPSVDGPDPTGKRRRLNLAETTQHAGGRARTRRGRAQPPGEQPRELLRAPARMPVLELDDADDLFGSRQRGRNRASALLDQADVSLAHGTVGATHGRSGVRSRTRHRASTRSNSARSPSSNGRHGFLRRGAATAPEAEVSGGARSFAGEESGGRARRRWASRARVRRR